MAVHQPATSPVPTEVYSQFLNTWTPAPKLATASLYMTAASVVLAEPGGGLHALPLGGTAWIYQATPPIDQVFVGTNRPLLEMTLVARAGLNLWAFNPRTMAWRAATTATPATTFLGNNSALILTDSKKAYGFGHWTDRWSAVDLSGPVVRSGIQVQSGYVDDGTWLHAFTAIGQVSTSHDYPNHWKAATLGARVRVDLAAEPRSSAILMTSLRGASIPLPPIGTLLLDPAFLVVVAAPQLAENGLFGFNLQVPLDPLFSGLDLHFQAAVFASSSLYLTNAIAIRVL
jgi:hypothetical protein